MRHVELRSPRRAVLLAAVRGIMVAGLGGLAVRLLGRSPRRAGEPCPPGTVCEACGLRAGCGERRPGGSPAAGRRP